MKIFLLILVLLVCLPYAVFAKKDKPPKVKIPKTRLISDFKNIRIKNIKKTKGDVEAVINFRSVDFAGEYYLGGEVQKYAETAVNKLLDSFKGDEFKEVIDDIKQKIKVFVVYDRTLNAHSTRSNNIVLTSQWLIDAKNDGEVVSVLAHELAHILLNHPDTNVDRKLQTNSLKKFTEMATVVTYLSGMRFNSNNGTLVSTQTKSSKSEVENAVKLGMLMNDVKLHYINTRVSRKNEDQADFFGIDMVNQAGYPVESEVTMLEILKSDEDKTTETIKLGESYLDLVQPAMQKWTNTELNRLAGDNITKQILAKVIQQNFNKIASSVGNWIKDKRRTHLKANVRHAKVSKYIDDFDLAEGRPSPSSNFEHIKEITQKVYSSFQQVELANYMIDAGSQYYSRANKILQEVTRTIKEKDVNLYQPISIMQWIVRSKLRIAQKRFKDASQNICQYLMHFPMANNCDRNNFKGQAMKLNIFIPQEVFTLLSEVYIHTDQLGKAKSIIAQGTEYYTDAQPFQLHNVMISCKEKNLDNYQSSLKQCLLSGDFGTEVSCKVINDSLSVMKKKAYEKIKKENPFGRVKLDDIQWWKSCQVITQLPFSSVKTKTQKQDIIKLANELIKKIESESVKENVIKMNADI